MNKKKAVLWLLAAAIVFLSATLVKRAWDYYHIPVYDSIEIAAEEEDDTTDGPRICLPEKVESEPVEEKEPEKPLSENTVGWITIDGIPIDNAVVQYTNNEHYLHYNEYDERDAYGAFFVNCGNHVSDAYDLDRVTTIFGHANGRATYPRFAYLKLLRDPEYATSCRTIVLELDGVKTEWRIFAVGDYPVENNYTLPNPSDDFFIWEISQMKAYSGNKYNVDVSSTDKILILSTCSGTGSYDTRYIVCAKLVSVG